VLQACLKANPGNSQVIDAILFLGAAHPTLAPGAAHATPAGSGQPADFHLPDEPPGRTFAWYEVWLKALTQRDFKSYQELLNDPLAGPRRAYWWTFCAAILSGLSTLALVQTFSPGTIDAGPFLGTFSFSQLGWAMSGAAFGGLGLLLVAATLNLIARSFGGAGNFARSVYMTSAWASAVIVCVNILPAAAFLLWVLLDGLLVRFAGTPAVGNNIGSLGDSWLSFYLSAFLALFVIVLCLIPLLLAFLYSLILATLQAAHRLNPDRARIAALLSVALLAIAAGFIYLVLYGLRFG